MRCSVFSQPPCSSVIFLARTLSRRLRATVESLKSRRQSRDSSVLLLRKTTKRLKKEGERTQHLHQDQESKQASKLLLSVTTLSVCLITSLQLQAATMTIQEEPSVTQITTSSWAWGTMMEQSPHGYGVDFEFFSPQFLRYQGSHRLSVRWYTDIGVQALPNGHIDNAGEYQYLTPLHFAAGFHVSDNYPGSNILTYFKWGASYLDQPKQLWGQQFSIGADFPYAFKLAESTESFNFLSFVVELTYNLYLHRFEGLPQEPNLYDGFSLSIGFRSHY